MSPYVLHVSYDTRTIFNAEPHGPATVSPMVLRVNASGSSLGLQWQFTRWVPIAYSDLKNVCRQAVNMQSLVWFPFSKNQTSITDHNDKPFKHLNILNSGSLTSTFPPRSSLVLAQSLASIAFSITDFSRRLLHSSRIYHTERTSYLSVPGFIYWELWNILEYNSICFNRFCYMVPEYCFV